MFSLRGSAVVCTVCLRLRWFLKSGLMSRTRCEKSRWWGLSVRGTPPLEGAECRDVESWRWNIGMIHHEMTASTGLPVVRPQMQCWRGVSVRARKSAFQYHRPREGSIG